MSKEDVLTTLNIKKLNHWIFDESVVEIFPDMIKKSVPGYDYILYMIGIIANNFISNNSNIYDLGCSLGGVTISILKNIKIKHCTIIAVDNSPAMIKKFSFNMKNYHHNTNTIIKIVQADIRYITITNTSLVILNFTLQFLKPISRLKLLRKIFNNLNYGGALIISEKFHFDHNTKHSLLYNMHYNFKKFNGYNDLEIIKKNKLLQKVMITDTIETHIKRLNKAGFININLWFQCLNFGSIIAIK